MADLLKQMPRERLDALNGWKALRPAQVEDGLLPDGDVLHLATAQEQGPEGPILARPIADSDPDGSFGGRSTPRGVAVSTVGDLYLADPVGGRILYTRASLPPEAPADSDIAPFVPLWSFRELPEADHPLNLSQPVDLCLLPVDVPPGAFSDCLVIADAVRNLLIWLDRRQILTRHVLSLPGTPLSCAAGPQGLIAVLLKLDQTDDILPGDLESCSPKPSRLRLALIRQGQMMSALLAVPSGVHSVIALVDGRFLLVGQEALFLVTSSGRVMPVEAPPDVPLMSPGFLVQDETLHLPGRCEQMDSLPYLHIPIDRYGRLLGRSYPLVTRPRRLPRPRAGRWLSQRFDGEARGFPWDRISLDLSVPAQCRLLVSTCVSDIAHEPDVLESMLEWSAPMVFESDSPSEFLVQHNKGRYLWLRIEAFGDGSNSPQISGIDIFGPRDSQLALLPAPFHQDPVSADFLDRFLSLQDGFLREALVAFARMGAILKPESTPHDFLDWLGSWFDWRFLSNWDDDTRREMIAQSIGFFTERGTLAGLERLLRWHTGLQGSLPRVIEEYRLARAIDAGGPEFLGGEPLTLEAGGAHRFCVLIPDTVVPDEAARETLIRLITAQKPAHTLFRLIVITPGVLLGQQARLGLDAILPDSRPAPLGEGRLDGELQTVAAC